MTSTARSYCETMVVEKTAALYAAHGATAALYVRHRTETGQLVTVDLLHAALHFARSDILMNNLWLKPTAPAKFPTINTLYNGLFAPTKDGRFVFSAPLSDKEWQQYVSVFAPNRYTELTTGEWKDIPGRLANFSTMSKINADIVKNLSANEYLSKAKQGEVACSVAKTFDEALQDEQVKHNKTIASKLESRGFGTFVYAKHPPVFSRTPSVMRSAAPSPGEHNEEIVDELRKAEASPSPDEENQTKPLISARSASVV